MLGHLFIAVGAVLMILGVISLVSWIGGKSLWFDPEAFDRRGGPKQDIMQQLYYFAVFAAVVLAPLLAGGAFIIYGLTLVF
jgi:hypothetical protein